MHVITSLDQMFAFRPLPEFAEYKTPIPAAEPVEQKRSFKRRGLFTWN
ncbi:MAG: hypothetical protein ACRYFS_17600 [Janthinobacterium lividum]